MMVLARTVCDAVVANAECVVAEFRGHAVLRKQVWLPFKKRHGPHRGQREKVRTSRISLK